MAENTRQRPPVPSDMEWLREQALEIKELRETQLLRDGHIYDSILRVVVEVVE